MRSFMSREARAGLAPPISDIAVISLLFAVAVGLEWGGSGSIVIADTQAYITSGVNMIRSGMFINASGAHEVWFPPLFPLLIGVTSLGDLVDPLLAGRLIAATCSLIALVVVWRIAYATTRSRAAAAAAALVLACNSLYQELAAQALSEPLATLLATTALGLWLRSADAPRRRDAVLLGAVVGTGYLVRPEVLLLLPAFAVVDLALGPRTVAWLKQWLAVYAVAATVFLLCAAPYVAYLYRETGRVTISNKAYVNLAMGRAEYYRLPREYIDPITLKMEFASYPFDRSAEMIRYVVNVRKIAQSYRNIFRSPWGLAIPLAAIGGFVLLWRRGLRRLACGLLAQFSYLVILARYEVAYVYLHATLPALAVTAGVGLSWALQQARHGAWLLSIGAALFSIWAGSGLVEQYTREPRWTFTQPVPNTFLKEAGLRLQKLTRGSGTLIASGGTLSYYSGLKRDRLTPNDLETLVAYSAATHRGQPVYLALTTFDSRLAPSVRDLLRRSETLLPTILDISDDRNRIAVFRLQ